MSHKAVKYTIPYFRYTFIMEKVPVGRLYTQLFIPTLFLFLYFLSFCYPYILLHFECFLLLIILYDVFLFLSHDCVCVHN